MKKFLSLFLALMMLLSFCACAPSDSSGTQTGDATGEKTDPQINTQTNAQTDAQTNTEAGTETEINRTDSASEEKDTPNLVLACDQAHDRVVVYDLAQYDGEDLDHNELWSFTPSRASRKCLSGAKYRTNTVFGDVVLIVASGGYAGIVKYPSKEVVWETDNCGTNPHSVEILPSGNLITAASDGATLRLYYTSALLNGDTAKAQTFKQYSFTNAHGVLWDPEYEMLWAEGGTLLRGYALSGAGTTETLVPFSGFSYDMKEVYGHGLAADMTDPDHLFIANTTLYSYDKQTNTMTSSFKGNRFLQRDDVKYFGNYADGSFVVCNPNKGKGSPWEKESYASWCTDTFYLVAPTESGYRTTKCKSGTCAYYKVLPFIGTYQ